MPQKTWTNAVLEAIARRMRADPAMVWLFELTPPVASNPAMPFISLEAELGDKRWTIGGIDEAWMVVVGLGAGLPFQIIWNHSGKLRYLTGQTAGLAGKYSKDAIDVSCQQIPGGRAVAPALPYDAKGKAIDALLSPDPVVCLYPAGIRMVSEDVRFDRATVRMEGSELTVLGSVSGMPAVLAAAAQLREAEMTAELIEIQVLRQMETATLIASVSRTRRPQAVDQGYHTLCPAAERVARCAKSSDVARFGWIAFSHLRPPASPEILDKMRRSADRGVAAVQGMV